MTDLFKDPQDQEDLDPNKDFLAELVGEDKKFKTAQDLARGKAEADRFITQLQGELAGIRRELATRVTLEQFMDKMGNNQGGAQTSQNGSDNQEDRGSGEKPLTLEDIERLVEDRVTGREKQRIEANNLQFVQQKLTEAFGNDYVSKLKATASETGMSEAALQNMAKESPKAFLKLVGAETAPQRQQTQTQNSLFTPPASETRGSFQPTADKNMAWYEDLRKKNPTEYWSPAVQNQMHKDAIRLGPKFFE